MSDESLPKQLFSEFVSSTPQYGKSNQKEKSGSNHNYIQGLIDQLSPDLEQPPHSPTSQTFNVDEQNENTILMNPLSPDILASEELLTTMIDDVQSRLSSMGEGKRGKAKKLRLTLQTLKSALVAERSQLRAARLDPLRYRDDEEDVVQERAKGLGLDLGEIPEIYTVGVDGEELEDEFKNVPRATSPTSTCGATTGDDITSILSPLPPPSTLADREGGLRERMARELSGEDRSKAAFSIHLINNYETQLTTSSGDSELTRQDILRAGMTPLLSDKKFVAFAYCSWCFKRTVHGRVQRNLLRRSRYKCTECSQVTLKCRAQCGAMARGHQDYDEELCANCDGTLAEWGEDRPTKSGYCSQCYRYATHHLMHRGYVLHDTYRCGYCKASTFLCATCHTDFGGFESNITLLSELLHYTCAKCSDQISSWEDPNSTGRKSTGSIESTNSLNRKQMIRYVHPFESFAEVRSHVACEALVDGKEFFEKAHQYLDGAVDTIFMSCWWLSPFIYLKRDTFPLSEHDKLTELLKRKADAGVQIFIIIWNNSLFLTLCSEEARDMVEQGHPNIHAIQEPSFQMPNFLWSHHQKFLVVDYSFAIVGGLDFAVGRYDTHEHQLSDLGVKQELIKKNKVVTPNQFRFVGPGLGKVSPLNLSPRLAPISSHPSYSTVLLPHIFDLSNETSPTTTRTSPSLSPELSMTTSKANPLKKFRNIRGMAELQAYLTVTSQEQGDHIWLGLDYYQPQDARPETYADPTKDIINRTQRCRMPWHDVSMSLEGLAAYDVANNFVERWNHHRKHHTFETVPKIGLPKPPGPPPTGLAGKGKFTCEVQIVRSLSEWSGLQNRTTEASVYGAYMAAISKAQHYIYIENQYIVSSTAGGGVENRIISAILDRIRYAIENKKTFRVFIMFPIPEETGKPANHMLQLSYQTLFRGGLSLLDQLRLEYPDIDPFDYVGFYFLRTYSVLPGVDTKQHHGNEDKKEYDEKVDLSEDDEHDIDILKQLQLVTDMVFVHSKLLLIDDDIAIIASTNLNDRSMLGDRDSELGAVVLDTKRIPILMDGVPTMARKFTYDLRVKLWREHLGLVGFQFENHPWVEKLKSDPICSDMYDNIWRYVAHRNTQVYEQVFPEIPSNRFRTFLEWENYLKSHSKFEDQLFHLKEKNKTALNKHNELSIETKLELLLKLQGHLCFHPTRFCHDDSLDWHLIEDLMGNEMVS